MRQLPILFFSIFVLYCTNTIAQISSHINCGNEGLEFTEEEQPSAVDPCFDVDEIMENCQTVWVNVNIHFFLDDNCEGGIQAVDEIWDSELGKVVPYYVDVEQGYDYAEGLINASNNFLDVMDASGTEQWSIEPALSSAPHCVPIRYLLKGVYYHCRSDVQNGELSSSDVYGLDEGDGTTPGLEQNGDTEINIYVMEINDASGVGWQNAEAMSVNALTDQWGHEGLLIHEMGHVLNLWHTHSSNDGCSDTPKTTVSYDANCDGDYNDTDIGDKNDSPCWDHGPIAASIDWDGDGVKEDMCTDYPECAGRHPCCAWENQSNNVMTYSAWSDIAENAVFTECQIRRMLTELATDKCDYIADITSECPPPSAFIDVQPEAIIEQGQCSYCIELGASMHDTEYELVFKDKNGVVINTTGILEGPAYSYCITTRGIKYPNEWPGGFRPNTTYTATLTVYNACGVEDSMEITFTTPETGCYEEAPDSPIKVVSLSPNPTRNQVGIQYELESRLNGKIMAVDILSGNQYPMLHIDQSMDKGIHESSIDISTWRSGASYQVFILAPEGVFPDENILIKQ